MAIKRSNSKRLKTYDAKRDFSKSPEPTGKSKAKPVKGLLFCVQKHLASHLHYDFRLEHDGVLLSWAVPKGPSLNPADKRLAMHVEDHPIAYGDFEGVIPSGYGAGVVMLWDSGTWKPEPGFEDVSAAMKKGELKFTVDGVKLKGSWILVRTRGGYSNKPSPSHPYPVSPSKEQWLLIKHRDQWSGEIDVLSEAPDSVKSFGDLASILQKEGTPNDWKTSPPARGGDAGAMFKQIMSDSTSARSMGVPPISSSKPRRTSRRKEMGGTPMLRKTISPAPPKPKLTLGENKPKLSNPQKVMYPKTGFTKGDVVDYYRQIAPLILPHLAGRSVTMKRYPDGVDGKMFFEKRCPDHRPEWVKTARFVTSSGKTIDQCDIADLSTLLWAANLAAIELHTPLALAADMDRPTAMVFDLDPGEPATTADCATIALRLKGLLDQLKLTSVIKTSGGKGLHVLVPLDDDAINFDDTKKFANAIARTLEKDDPKRVIASMSRAARSGKVFIDWSQNDRNKTTCCVFSLRARETQTISWPIAWASVRSGKAIASPTADDQLDLKAAKATLAGMKKSQRLPTNFG